ncbi:beta-galactosidase [Lentisphaera marina]|uniref:beta-galactosidase n=1 Tax=Lentisphaera marina TaxID=1111041 RepID=UPI002365243D|nr:beta-galactosidase [Lentisphaera marina]MDD7986176.1 beta-galactosidase [Lentisphaera marina]
MKLLTFTATLALALFSCDNNTKVDQKVETKAEVASASKVVLTEVASAPLPQSPGAYKYWPKYEKTPVTEMRAAEWLEGDHISSGWDWSLPSHVKPSPNGRLCIARLNRLNYNTDKALKEIKAPVTPVLALWLKWKDMEPVEGQYNFDLLNQKINEAAERGYKVVYRPLFSATVFAPDWLKKYKIPHREEHKDAKVTNYQVDHPEFHSRYLRFINAMGKSKIVQNPNLVGAFFGYASPSYGDEGIGPHGKDPDKVPHVIERINAWAQAFKGHESKVFMGGWSKLGVKKGFGLRRGFVEMYLYHLPSEETGQRLDKDFYLDVDEDSFAVDGRFNGDENEEYEESWASAKRGFRFGKNTDSFSYRYFTSNLRALQMRSNYLLYNHFSLIPEQLVWVGQSMGKSIEDSPDVWCALRESYIKTWGFRNYKQDYFSESIKGKEFLPVKNFERGLKQRNTAVSKSEALVKIPHGVHQWMTPKDRSYDLIARKADQLIFNIDSAWLAKCGEKIAVKISYFDHANGEIYLKGFNKSKVILKGSNDLKTVTYFINKSELKGQQIIIEGAAPLSFVRLIKVNP